jgi:hypothetical protein
MQACTAPSFTVSLEPVDFLSVAYFAQAAAVFQDAVNGLYFVAVVCFVQGKAVTIGIILKAFVFITVAALPACDVAWLILLLNKVYADPTLCADPTLWA